MLRRFLYIVACALALYACKADRISDDPSMQLTFQQDTVRFDTVFTGFGSATQVMKIYNHNDYGIRISSVRLTSGKYFHINLDGEPQPAYMSGIEVRGGDSLYLFITVEIDPSAEDMPVLVEDAVEFDYNSRRQSLVLEAIGQNVHLVQSPHRRTNCYRAVEFDNDRPYLIYDSLFVYGNVTIKPGARLYFHQGASLWCYGNVTAEGNESQPISLLGDRLDRVFEHVPYSVTSGQWGGWCILDTMGGNHTYELKHVHISGANWGLVVENGSTLTLDHCKIHNHLRYGLAIENVDSKVTNTEISNVARNCVYLAGGEHTWNYTTVANYFYNTSINIHHISADSVVQWRYSMPVVYVDEAASKGLKINNSIVTGLNKKIIGCEIDSLAPDSFPGSWVHKDTAHVFRNVYYEYGVYTYYDFRLDSLSPARGIAKDSTDAGCYPYTPY